MEGVEVGAERRRARRVGVGKEDIRGVKSVEGGMVGAGRVNSGGGGGG